MITAWIYGTEHHSLEIFQLPMSLFQNSPGGKNSCTKNHEKREKLNIFQKQNTYNFESHVLLSIAVDRLMSQEPSEMTFIVTGLLSRISITKGEGELKLEKSVPLQPSGALAPPRST